MRIPVYLEVGAAGVTRAWVLVLPGVAIAGRSPAAALAALPACVAEETARLDRLGRPWAHAGEPLEFVETERVDVNLDLGSGASTALFKYDLRPTRPEDVATALDRFALACRELEAAASRPEGAPAGHDERLLAVAEGIDFLLSRLGSKPGQALPVEPLPRFLAAEQMAIERLTNLLPGDIERHAVFLGEPWTTRKVLRRLVLLVREEALLLASGTST
jgi:hypothetical protein